MCIRDRFYKAEKIKRVSSEISQEEIARILNIPEKLLENVYEVGDTSFITVSYTHLDILKNFI